MVKGVKCKRTSARKGIVCLILMIAVTLILASCAGQSGEGDSSAGAGGSGDAPAQNGGKNGADPPESVIVEGEDLVIPVADITEKASFYPVQVDGTQMEIIAVKAPDGTLRTAFNTCQICFDSGRGYYVQTGDVLVCQNCGNQFPMNSVEVEAGGCNPWPIFPENKTVTDESITITNAWLKEAKEIFANWKRS